MNTTKYPQIPGITLTNTEILLVAKSINVSPAALKAVQVVETAGRSGFIASGKPTILFEGHIFWKQLRIRKINPMQHTNGNAIGVILHKFTTEQAMHKTTTQRNSVRLISKQWCCLSSWSSPLPTPDSILYTYYI
jgi:hypothetical protein